MPTKNTNQNPKALRNTLLGFSFFGGVLLVLSGSILSTHIGTAKTKVIFLEVGQGDAILITEGSYQILIDGGPDGRVLLEELGKHIPFWDREIELVIATHPDSDHIDGLVDLVQNYQVQEFWSTSIERDTSVFTALMRNLRNRNIKQAFPESGWSIRFPSGAQLEIIYPFAHLEAPNLSHEPNNISITSLFAAGEEVFFLGGDLHKEVEDLLPIDESITVLKIGHHGSETSTSDAFLEKTRPREVVFSVGKKNRYGHPSSEIIKRVENRGMTIYRTDQDGSIVYTCHHRCEVKR